MKPRKPAKNKRKTLTIFTCGVLVALSVFGVGFSSWIVVTEESNKANIAAADLELTQINVFTILQEQSFLLSRDGIDEDHKIVQSGDYIISLTINNQACAQLQCIDELGNFKMKATLTDSKNGSTFLNYCDGLSAKVNSIPIDNVNKSGFASNYISYDLTFSLDTSAETSNLALIYCFSGDLSSFYNNLPTLTFKAEVLL